MGDAIAVREGQIWADNDKRSKGRKVLILAIDRRNEVDFAICEVKSVAKGYDKKGIGKKTLVRLDRFRPTSAGYRLVRDVPRPAVASSEPPPTSVHSSCNQPSASADAETTKQGEV